MRKTVRWNETLWSWRLVWLSRDTASSTTRSTNHPDSLLTDRLLLVSTLPTDDATVIQVREKGGHPVEFYVHFNDCKQGAVLSPVVIPQVTPTLEKDMWNNMA